MFYQVWQTYYLHFKYSQLHFKYSYPIGSSQVLRGAYNQLEMMNHTGLCFL